MQIDLCYIKTLQNQEPFKMTMAEELSSIVAIKDLNNLVARKIALSAFFLAPTEERYKQLEKADYASIVTFTALDLPMSMLIDLLQEAREQNFSWSNGWQSLSSKCQEYLTDNQKKN